METCATHGLRYDPAQHSGCVLCRRAAAESVGEPISAAVHAPKVVRVALVAAGALGVAALAWVLVMGPSSVVESSSVCSETCARKFEPCFERCRGLANGENCQSACMSPAHDCLSACSELQGLQPGQLRFAYASGEEPPAWSAVQASIERAVADTGSCELPRGAYSARFDVRPDGTLGHVTVGSPFEPASFCLRNRYTGRVKGLPASSAEYAFSVQGVPPPPPPPPPVPVAAKPPPKPQKPVDYLALVNGMTAEQAEKEAKAAKAAKIVMIDRGPSMPPEAGVAVAGPVGAEPKIVSRSALELMKQRCGIMPNDQRECLAMVDSLKASLVELPVNDRVGASSAVRAYEMNRGGLGFDCVWFQPPKFPESEFRRRDAEGRGWAYPILGLIIASSPESYAFASASSLEPFHVDVANPPWPATYRAIISYHPIIWGGPLKPGAKPLDYRPFGLCLNFDDDKTATVHIGVAFWMDGPSAHDDKDDAEAFNQEVLSALGVKGSWSRKRR